MAFTFVDSAAAVATMINSIVGLPKSPPSLYFDLEGVNLSRKGSISIFQLLVHPQNKIYLIDIHVLGGTAFTTPGVNGNTFQSILESSAIPKACFDVRNDSDALYFHHGIALEGVHDIQLMENASRQLGYPRKYLTGLIKCIEYDAPMTIQAKNACKAIKEKGLELFAPEKGGSYQVFNTRPLHEDIKAYCVQDVRFLPLLWKKYWDKLDASWKAKVDVETRARVQSSQSAEYEPHGSQKAYGPWQIDAHAREEHNEAILEELGEAGFDDPYNAFGDGRDYEDWFENPNDPFGDWAT